MVVNVCLEFQRMSALSLSGKQNYFPREQTLSAQYTVLLRRQIVVIISSSEINCGAQTKLGNGNFTTYKIF